MAHRRLVLSLTSVLDVYVCLYIYIYVSFFIYLKAPQSSLCLFNRQLDTDVDKNQF